MNLGLIDADKVVDWLVWYAANKEQMKNVDHEFLIEYEVGTFDLTPPVQPDTGYKIFLDAEIDEQAKKIAKEKGWIK